MRNMKLFAMACVLGLSASPLLAADKMAAKPAAKPAAKAPATVQDCWQPAFEAMDAAAVAQCYAPDAVLWLPGAPMMKGRDAIREGYVGFFKDFNIKSMKLAEAGKSRLGNDAASWGSFELVMESKKDGKEVTELGRYTDVSRKIGGHWMYVVDHASDDPAPAPANPPAATPQPPPAK
jgi:uncharacterized protein (TIGR02246 family)